ncbi:hypothetical protein B0T09DRAFT_389730 [Sordaria sp. MPI-SDFR-AT-0083]|nr:hypothetical protein B0T09DRAFT_389730 [Sordaria sp. MPI-SDFR-AT-0083]
MSSSDSNKSSSSYLSPPSSSSTTTSYKTTPSTTSTTTTTNTTATSSSKSGSGSSTSYTTAETVVVPSSTSSGVKRKGSNDGLFPAYLPPVSVVNWRHRSPRTSPSGPPTRYLSVISELGVIGSQRAAYPGCQIGVAYGRGSEMHSASGRTPREQRHRRNTNGNRQEAKRFRL